MHHSNWQDIKVIVTIFLLITLSVVILYAFKLIINGNTYESLTDIHLFLFNLFDYKNFEYIDLYLKQQIEKTPIDIEDFYNDNYDDFNNEFIAIRNLILNKRIFKMKFILKNNEFYLYYNLDVISGFDNILEKIKEIIQLIMSSNQSS